jgi:hypothetical protein
MVFWFGFALPVPWAFGIARVALLALAWGSLTPRRVGRDRPAS